jgi:hypothetical protein
VTVPLLLPEMVTLTPAIGFPAVSLTFPFTMMACAKIDEEKTNIRMEKRNKQRRVALLLQTWLLGWKFLSMLIFFR